MHNIEITFFPYQHSQVSRFQCDGRLRDCRTQVSWSHRWQSCCQGDISVPFLVRRVTRSLSQLLSGRARVGVGGRCIFLQLSVSATGADTGETRERHRGDTERRLVDKLRTLLDKLAAVGGGRHGDQFAEGPLRWPRLGRSGRQGRSRGQLQRVGRNDWSINWQLTSVTLKLWADVSSSNGIVPVVFRFVEMKSGWSGYQHINHPSPANSPSRVRLIICIACCDIGLSSSHCRMKIWKSKLVGTISFISETIACKCSSISCGRVGLCRLQK